MARNLREPVFRKTLLETALWCSRQSLLPKAEETPEIKHRRDLVTKASKLLRRSSFKSYGWSKAMEMLREAAPDSLVPLESQLRSEELRIPTSIVEMKYEQKIQAIIAELVVKRQKLLSMDQIPDWNNTGLQSMGKLLLYLPFENVADGASQYSSEGFFDLYDCPPWDCWIHYSDGELYSWVPKILIPLAQAGMDVNCVDCIQWVASEAYLDFV